MKAAGISLFNIMKPLIILIAFICIGAFYFQDKIMPVVQLKQMSLLSSFRQKSPELAIPEGAFYSEIKGYTLYVRKNDTKNNLLKDLMIYDFSNGYDNTIVTLADEGKLRFTADKKNLVFTLYNGEGFSNFNNQQSGNSYIPYRREQFKQKEIVLNFDGNFNRIDESNFADLHFSKNTHELSVIIDSVGHILDSLGTKTRNNFVQTQYMERRKSPGYTLKSPDSIALLSPVKPFYPNVDSLLKTANRDKMLSIVERAKDRATEIRNDLEYKQLMLANETFQFRRSSIEYHRKFTLSFACLIFFFIGAPLGAIIRKGGIGLPAVVSVFLFIIYYMIDITGYKFARDGVWDPISGGWISSFVLLPLGLFLTYKAVNDSVILNPDAYILFSKTWLNPKWIWSQLNKQH
jgi:lipopolysaccharide export system permease protein